MPQAIAISPCKPGHSRLTAITGGIGAGKSVVSDIIRAIGYSVYDCDSRAKALMDADTDIHAALSRDIHPRCVVDGVIDRRLIADIVFADAKRLAVLNGIVHAAVRADLLAWRAVNQDERRLFVETAILTESGLDGMVDDVWEVTAPEQLRIDRVMKRNSMSAEAVRARIASQSPLPAGFHLPVHTICNDGVHPLLPRIEELLA
ncbi:MAG: dephospho-CoA kinase [Candidatus Amulumruptor caecigallinarius]|nr:dephospho-CoA kinase [Candidatus Amulumruptor caecigallinarius]MCM1395924.1 dephospho-CoA kinase [Candidatus Amulumruptor caecigallinarius]MCM1452959.1 dephospho-CoA kinase [bacterium]